MAGGEHGLRSLCSRHLVLSSYLLDNHRVQVMSARGHRDQIIVCYQGIQIQEQRSLDKDPRDTADFGVKQHNNSSKSLGLRFQNRGKKTFIWKKASWRG